MKTIKILLVTMICLGLAGCSKDVEINAFITEFDAVTQEMVKQINADPSAAGVDAAQKAFDAKKGSLKAKWDGIKNVRGYQVGAVTKKKLEDSVTNNIAALREASTKNMMKLGADKEAVPKFNALLTDFQGMFGIEPTVPER